MAKNMTATQIAQRLKTPVYTVRYVLSVLRRRHQIPCAQYGMVWVYPPHVVKEVKQYIANKQNRRRMRESARVMRTKRPMMGRML